MSKKSSRSLPVFIAMVSLLAAILALVLPFMYASLNKTNILGFCLIFGGSYNFEKDSIPVVINFNWALFFAWLFLIFSSLYSLLYCRKHNQYNSIITFLFLTTSSILFLLSQKFCIEVMSGNAGYEYSTYPSCGPLIVAGLSLLADLCSLIDVCKKRHI